KERRLFVLLTGLDRARFFWYCHQPMETTLLSRIKGDPSVLLDGRSVRNVPGDGRESKYGAFVRASVGHDSFAGLLRTFRRRLSITQAEAARRLGLSKSTYVKWEEKLRLPESDPSNAVSAEFKLTASDESSLSKAWEADSAERSKRRSELMSVAQRFTTRARAQTTPDWIKREDTRIRVRRKRACDLLKRKGYMDRDGNLTAVGRSLSEKAIANYPDPRLDERLSNAFKTISRHQPKPNNFRTGANSFRLREPERKNENEGRRTGVRREPGLREGRAQGDPGGAGEGEEAEEAACQEAGERAEPRRMVPGGVQAAEGGGREDRPVVPADRVRAHEEQEPQAGDAAVPEGRGDQPGAGGGQLLPDLAGPQGLPHQGTPDR
ncbi:MAG: helix-turn-helix transcriptional regulator, partial [Candidatus Methanomethylophilus sp.]|nr:helix-turn-helix transcriptional regulator [Methanomethylophilus sp.]